MSIKKRESTNIHFIKLKIIKLPDLYFYNVCLFMYNYNQNNLPPAFNNYFVKNSECHVINTRSANLYRMPLTKQSLGEKFVKKTGVVIWNQIQKKINIDSPIGIFKTLVKNFIFEKYQLL